MKKIIDYLNTLITNLNLFDNVYGLAVKISEQDGEDEKLYPVIYCGKDDHDDIAFETNCAYHIKNGAITIQDVDPHTGSKDRILQEIPLKLYVRLNKSNSQDDSYSDIDIAQTLLKSLHLSKFKGGDIDNDLKGSIIGVSVTNIEDDRDAVFADEFTNTGEKPRYDTTYLFIEYTLSWEIDVSCLEGVCD